MKKDKEFYGKLLAILIPVALQNLLGAVVNASDALMLGSLSQDALSAISLATQIQFLQSLFVGAVSIGTTVLAAQYWGKGDKGAVERILGVGLGFSMIASLAFAFLAVFAPGMLMRIYTNDTNLIALGTPYLRIVSLSYIFFGISQIYLTIMKNSGRTTRSTVYGSTAVVMNLLFNYLLIFGIGFLPRMEIEGAALATVIARGIELLLVVCENLKKDVIKIRIRKILVPDKLLRQDFVKYATPVLLNLMAWGFGVSMFSVILGHLGNDAVAANSISSLVKNIMVCAASGLSAGAGIVVGNELGANELEKAKNYGDKLCHLAIIIGAVAGVIIVVLSPVIIHFVNLTDIAKGYLRIMLYICGYYMIGSAINKTVISGIFTAGGDTKFGFICDTVTLWVICVPLGLLSAFVFKLPLGIVFFILNLDEVIKLPVVYKHYKKYNWLNNITK